MRDIRICYIGDSFVNGTGDPDKLGWTGRLSAASADKKNDITHYNLGIRRETSQDIAERWEAECQARLPEMSENKVVFSYGVNDTVMEAGRLRVSLKHSIANTGTILLKASQKYDVIMIGPPPIDDREQNKRIKALDAEFKTLCADLDIPYLSIFEKLNSEPIWIDEVTKNDGAHPRAEGYALLADYIKSWEGWWF